MDILQKVEIKKLDFPIDFYNYNAMIFRSVDSGKTYFYCGCGKYFATLEEAEGYKRKNERR